MSAFDTLMHFAIDMYRTNSLVRLNSSNDSKHRLNKKEVSDLQSIKKHGVVHITIKQIAFMYTDKFDAYKNNRHDAKRLCLMH